MFQLAMIRGAALTSLHSIVVLLATVIFLTLSVASCFDVTVGVWDFAIHACIAPAFVLIPSHMLREEQPHAKPDLQGTVDTVTSHSHSQRNQQDSLRFLIQQDESEPN